MPGLLLRMGQLGAGWEGTPLLGWDLPQEIPQR